MFRLIVHTGCVAVRCDVVHAVPRVDLRRAMLTYAAKLVSTSGNHTSKIRLILFACYLYIDVSGIRYVLPVVDDSSHVCSMLRD